MLTEFADVEDGPAPGHPGAGLLTPTSESLAHRDRRRVPGWAESRSLTSANRGTIISHYFLPLYYTHYDTIIFHYDTITSLISLQMSRLLFFIISLT